MQKEILVTYATGSGSTAEVAQAIAEELRKNGATAQVKKIDEVEDLSAYAGVVIGAPMILGWHRAAVQFLKKHRQALSRIPVAYFFTAMSLTRTLETQVKGVPVFVDPDLAKEPKKPGHLSFRESYANVARYLSPALGAAPSVKPVSVGFFAGKLDFSRLKLLQMLFVMLIVQAQPGDRRNWPAIRGWADNLAAQLTN